MGSGPADPGQKDLNLPHNATYDATHKNPTPKTFKNFQIHARRLAAFLRVWTDLSLNRPECYGVAKWPNKREIFRLPSANGVKDRYWMRSYIFIKNSSRLCLPQLISISIKGAFRNWFSGLKFRHGNTARAKYTTSQIRWWLHMNLTLPS